MPAIAAATGVLYVLIAAPALGTANASAPMILASAGLAAGLSILTAIDLKTMRLPDVWTLPLIALGLILAALLDWQPGLLERALAAAGAFAAFWVLDAVYFALRQRPGLGLGDAKLFAAAGAWLGAGALSSVLLYASISALIYALALQVRGAKIGAGTAIPFGPFLALAIWLVWIYGPIAV